MPYPPRQGRGESGPADVHTDSGERDTIVLSREDGIVRSTAQNGMVLRQKQPQLAQGPTGSGAQDEDASLYSVFMKRFKGNAHEALFAFCAANNLFYEADVAKACIKQADESPSPLPVYEAYRKEIARRHAIDGKDFLSQLKRENFETIYSEDLRALYLSPEDKKNRQQIISIINYDPFSEEPEEEKPNLYRGLCSMLTESMRGDYPKIVAAIEFARNYASISRYNAKCSALEREDLGDKESQKRIEYYRATIAKLQDTNNKIAKENGFSSNSRNGVAGGRGTLSSIMSMADEKGYDPLAVNFYDVETSASIREVADISFAAMFEQAKFNDNDYAQILANQCRYVRDLRTAANKAIEAARLALEKLEKQELLAEYEQELSKKGIDMDDVKAIVAQEIDLHGEV